ncbi:MAG TPA: type II toxin-antitoxin system VapC family toxin [Acidimicrobiales bacterium]|nr:type II toxin-antitoxin system VapC family toxin [Acidimicrobiales bacterium]
MITYVDTSTLLKLVVDEEGSDRAELVWEGADALASVTLLIVEARAALAAAVRGRRLTRSQHGRALEEVDALVAGLHLVEVTDELITGAADLADVEGLRAYDAVHLAAAVLVGATVLTSADEALCAAAARRGLHVANPLDR